MSITEQEYNKACVRLEEIIDLVDDEAPEDDPLWQELVQVSNTIEAYEEIHYAIGEPTRFETLKLRMSELVQKTVSVCQRSLNSYPLYSQHSNKEHSGNTGSKTSKVNPNTQQRKVREGWVQAAKEAHEREDDKLMMDFPNEFDREEWTTDDTM